MSTVTRLVSTVCYHSPHLLAPMVAGLAPYTAAPHAEVPPSIRLVSLISTISSIYLSISIISSIYLSTHYLSR